MSVTNRQNRLLLAEDWKRVYQTFRNADFRSYDFDGLRRTMIAYIRENYPEDFNDYIDSSEYLALIDLIAFLGQNISYRIDLNSRENFLELAERRESVLRLARLLSYNPKRNQCANGLIKFEAVSTTEEVVDSNGTNLATQTIVWNDPANPDWREQFEKVLNAALPVNSKIGRPVKKDTVEGIPTYQYRYRASNTDVPVFSYSKNIDGRNLQFQIVSADVISGVISEEPPLPGNSLAFLYKDDGRGPGSTNSGYFCHFRQGTLDQGSFSVNTPSTNQTIAIDATNINNTDVWLYKLNSIGAESELWTKVDAVEGNNIVYNSLRKNLRNIYAVLTQAQDKINLIFSDGTFGNLPKGDFRVYYRSSINQAYDIIPADMASIGVAIPYTSAVGNQETLNITLSLKYTIDNASTTESNSSIRENAPATYYTQNRMVTGEDYQVAPLRISQEIVKVKSVNRTASGISRYFDLLDSTGKYSSTNLFGNDGLVYKETLTKYKNFTYTTKIDLEGIIEETIQPVLAEKQLLNYYLTNFPKTIASDLGANWVQTTKGTNQTTGHLQDSDGTRFQVGSYTGSSLRFLEEGTLIKFLPPAGYHFMKDGTLMAGDANHPGSFDYKWVKVVSIVGDGAVDNTDGSGPIILNDIVPSTAVLNQIVPKFSKTLVDNVKTQIVDQLFSNKTFGLRYDINLRQWRVVIENNLNILGEFSLGKTGDTTNQQLDASWLLLFETDGEKYTITYRSLRYIFESAEEIRFYYDSADKVFDNKTGQIIKDKISVLSINLKPDALTPFTIQHDWEISDAYRDSDGYVDSKKVEVSFYDADEDGVVDDPETFLEIVNEAISPLTKFIFQKKYITTDGIEDYSYVDGATLDIKQSESVVGALSQYTDGQVFYLVTENVFKTLTSGTLVLTTEYRAFVGRDKLKFQYIHAADDDNRIDPSSSNVIDTYLLTKSYDASFREFLDGAVTVKPLPPSSDNLFNNYGSEINKIKSISDEVIYHPVKYKVLFGANADLDLQATFKIVKNPDQVVNTNAIKAKVISAVNRFFALDNWDFGDTFYFSELSTFIMASVAPDLVTIVIVPNQELQGFGSLYEIKSEADEIFISGAIVDNVEVIDAVTASRLKASGKVLTVATATNSGLQSASTYTTSTTSSSSGSNNV
jgi:hypothetical protein